MPKVDSPRTSCAQILKSSLEWRESEMVWYEKGERRSSHRWHSRIPEFRGFGAGIG